MTENINKSKGVDRRTVIKGAAWAAPVVAVAVSAPLAAASITDGYSGLNIRSNNAGTNAEFRPNECYVEFVGDGGAGDNVTGPITFTFNVPAGFTASNGGSALGASGAIGEWTYVFDSASGVYTFTHQGITLSNAGTTTVNVPSIVINHDGGAEPPLSNTNQITADLRVQNRSNLNKHTVAPS